MASAAVADFMEAEEDFMGVVAILELATLGVGAVAAMVGGAVVTAGMEVGTGMVGTVATATGGAGTVEATDAVTTVEGTGVDGTAAAVRIGMVDTPIGGGGIHTRMLTDLTIGSRRRCGP
jgi:hypothetical protein